MVFDECWGISSTLDGGAVMACGTGIEECEIFENNDELLSSEKTYSSAPHRVFNIGNSSPTNLMDFINALENEIGIQSIKKFREIQPGDVIATSANTSKIKKWINFNPKTSIRRGINLFIYDPMYLREDFSGRYCQITYYIGKYF